MKSSQPSPERVSQATPSPVLVADGGLPAVPRITCDPFEALDDLMTVVEALCPMWPPRETGGPMRDLRL
jgi:hypothetical protein